MARGIQSPLDGGPRTQRGRDRDGNTVLTVRLRALTPWRAKYIDRGTLVLAIYLSLEGLANLLWQSLVSPVFPTGWQWLFGVFGPFLVLVPFRIPLGWLWAKRATVMITPEVIEIRSLWRSRRFDRQAPHDFALIPHDWTQREKESLQFWERRFLRAWWMLPQRRYYADSFHLSLNYLGQRNDVLTVFGRKRALVLQARLKACDEIMSAQSGQSGGVATRPQEEWPSQPGGELPDL